MDLAGIWKVLEPVLEKAGKGDVPWIVVLIVFVVIQRMLIKGVYEKWVESRNDEIKRLVTDRDKLHDIVMKDRLHAGIDESGRKVDEAKTKKVEKKDRGHH